MPPNDSGDDVGRTKLYKAVQSAKPDTVSRYIQLGADVNKSRSDTGESPLLLAIRVKNRKIVDLLLDAGADVNHLDKEGRTALTLAIQSSFEVMINRLIQAGANVNLGRPPPLFDAAGEYDLPEIVQKLLEMGADPNIPDPTSLRTPLSQAIVLGNERSIAHLLRAGANPNIPDKDGMTPFLYASFRRKEVLPALIRAGADLRTQDANGHTALHFAVSMNDIRTIQLLLTAGVDLNTQDVNGQSVLHLAVIANDLPMVQLLMKEGADKTLRDKKGLLAVHYAPTWSAIRRLLEDKPKRYEGPMLMWEGWTRGDASKLDGIFDDDAISKNFALCPVCMKYVERSEACMYMGHNCQESKGYYHEGLYYEYMNSMGIVNWCTICGRISKGHNHFVLGAAAGPAPNVIPGKDPFATTCEGEGGGGVREKLIRFRRLREKARELQLEVGKIGWWEAMDGLCEAMWDAPLKPINVSDMQVAKKFNIPNTNFPVSLPTPPNAPNIPHNADALPIVHPHETPTLSNAFYMDDVNILQFQHRQENGGWNRHDKEGQQISREAFVGWLRTMLENPTAEGFGRCWQYKTKSQQAALNNSKKALSCTAILHPQEVRAALDMSDAEQAKLAEGYRKAFNEVFDERRTYRPAKN